MTLESLAYDARFEAFSAAEEISWFAKSIWVGVRASQHALGPGFARVLRPVRAQPPPS
jgi:hypothetical protein